MFREMRRCRQQLTQAECQDILEIMTFGVLSVSGDDGYPYAVPLSYVYHEGRIYFHSAQTGHKIDAISNCPKVSFCVVQMNELHPEKYTTWFRSVIAFGQAHIIEDPQEKLSALRMIGVKYGTDNEETLKAELDKTIDRVAMIRLDIEHLTGKEAKELARQDGRL
jgi:nitroimidazol reductase NimA-like FMN-containing flavoprotein (pyridoxamine 5'-phosphate oxidase superfamily)